MLCKSLDNPTMSRIFPPIFCLVDLSGHDDRSVLTIACDTENIVRGQNPILLRVRYIFYLLSICFVTLVFESIILCLNSIHK